MGFYTSAEISVMSLDADCCEDILRHPLPKHLGKYHVVFYCVLGFFEFACTR